MTVIEFRIVPESPVLPVLAEPGKVMEKRRQFPGKNLPGIGDALTLHDFSGKIQHFHGMGQLQLMGKGQRLPRFSETGGVVLKRLYKYCQIKIHFLPEINDQQSAEDHADGGEFKDRDPFFQNCNSQQNTDGQTQLPERLHITYIGHMSHGNQDHDVS